MPRPPNPIWEQVEQLRVPQGGTVSPWLEVPVSDEREAQRVHRQMRALAANYGTNLHVCLVDTPEGWRVWVQKFTLPEELPEEARGVVRYQTTKGTTQPRDDE